MSIIFYIVHDGRQCQNKSQYIKSSLEIFILKFSQFNNPKGQRNMGRTTGT